MDGNTLTTSNILYTIPNIHETKDRKNESMKLLLRNVIVPHHADQMAIKENDKYVYGESVRSSILSYMNNRKKNLQDAKNTFLKSTINFKATSTQSEILLDKMEPTLHYARIAVTNTNDDTRSTGGGKRIKESNDSAETLSYVSIKKKFEQPRKVSFKIKRSASNHRRPPIGSKTVTITSSKVAELTKKFNDLVNESNGTVKHTKLVKTIENLQTVSRCPISNNSTPSSTLSSSPNIKIVLRPKRGSKKRSAKKRCSSVDAIDKLSRRKYSPNKVCVIRSKSDGSKKPKTKKRLLDNDSSEQQSGSDSVDGSPTKLIENNILSPNKIVERTAVKNVIKKFECEFNAKSDKNVNGRKRDYETKIHITADKPKIPEKKSSLIVTKNLVVKDGVPKIKTVKPVINSVSKDILPKDISKDSAPRIMLKKKDLMYDHKKYKTNYIHSDKLPLQVVEIIHEDVDENKEKEKVCVSMNISINESKAVVQEEKNYEEISNRITPNESFLWRQKSGSQIYSDSEKSMSDGPYSLLNITSEANVSSVFLTNTEVFINDESSTIEVEINESPDPKSDTENKGNESNSDFETNLVEAYNKEVIVGYTSKPQHIVVEDDYEPLQPVETFNDVVVTPIRNSFNRQSSKMNCPLPEIPKDCDSAESQKSKNNIYQCLLEMRSHPEGDENSLHNYELCENELEERTRGDGDSESDDGYEYCKSPIKPYCHTSSSGIRIAEDYQPFPADGRNKKNYEISKSVSGTSTVSYEKIGCDRIYEKIPAHLNKTKNTSPPSYSKRHSIASSDYTAYNDNENIYDTIKHADGASLSHCYESIPNSPSMVKPRNNFRKQLASTIQKRLSFDNVSNISHSTISSEQKTNSIYGQRSMLSYNGHEIAFRVPNSETSVSDRSDRSDDWVDVSDEEKNNEQKIIIVRERSRGRKSPISWSQKVRHQWQKSPKKKKQNNEGESSDSGHVYESLTPRVDDLDSFDSDSDFDEPNHQPVQSVVVQPPSQLPEPPGGGGGLYRLTLKMRELKRNLTKRYSVALDGKAFNKSSVQNGTIASDNIEKGKNRTPIYANCRKSAGDIHVYGNISYPEQKMTPTMANKTDVPLKTNGIAFKEELKNIIGEKKSPNGEVPPPLPKKLDKPATPTVTESSKSKENGTLSRKAYFSFKSRFRRATSMAVDINTEVPGPLKITNSTFYLTDSMDGDSGFSNCSDAGQATGGSVEALQTPIHPPRRRDGNRLARRACSESSPCLALERPSVPPPPPPGPLGPGATTADLSAVNEELKRLLPTLSRKEKSPHTRTSWYADCGSGDDSSSRRSHRTISNSWYAEAGVYGGSLSSSGASSSSQPASPLPRSLFTHEPLYQFYIQSKVESVCRETLDSDSDTYEVSTPSSSILGAPGTQSPSGLDIQPPEIPRARPSAMALVAPTRGPQRTLWCEVPEVINSTVLSSLAPVQKRLQEAKFELLTSEASYLNSLNVLETHFASHPALREPYVLLPDDWALLFANVLPVRKCSQLLMNELEKCWQENILLHGLCDIVRRHAERHFHVYVKYCENQAHMVRALQRLRGNPAFAAALRRLEAHPACQSLSLHSFLMLPMQRVTRLPLLMDAVLKNLHEADNEYRVCMDTLATLNNFVSQCNEGARNTERIDEMYRLCERIEFAPHMRSPPELGPAVTRRDRRPRRWLVRSGELTRLVWRSEEPHRLTFGKKYHKIPLHLFLFNDYLVVTKKRGDDSYLAVDFCPRSLLEVSAGDSGVTRHSLLITLLENHDGRTVEMLMSCASETDASRWSEALRPPTEQGENGEAIYAGWDCPQVAALYSYTPAQPDELPLAEGDVVNVTRKTAEGWYYGERIRDGETGWFPGTYTAEIASAHVRARNLRQRYRLLALSTNFGQKKRPT